MTDDDPARTTGRETAARGGMLRHLREEAQLLAIDRESPKLAHTQKSAKVMLVGIVLIVSTLRAPITVVAPMLGMIRDISRGNA